VYEFIRDLAELETGRHHANLAGEVREGELREDEYS
jgi:hypothetical protein